MGKMDPFPLSPTLTLLPSPHLWPNKCWVIGTAWAYCFSDQVYWHVTAFPSQVNVSLHDKVRAETVYWSEAGFLQTHTAHPTGGRGLS